MTEVTIEDGEMENCLGKAKLTSAEGCTGALAQQAWGGDNLSSFHSRLSGPCHCTWIGQAWMHNLLIIG
jgi:hypothetical protein